MRPNTESSYDKNSLALISYISITTFLVLSCLDWYLQDLDPCFLHLSELCQTHVNFFLFTELPKSIHLQLVLIPSFNPPVQLSPNLCNVRTGMLNNQSRRLSSRMRSSLWVSLKKTGKSKFWRTKQSVLPILLNPLTFTVRLLWNYWDEKPHTEISHGYRVPLQEETCFKSETWSSEVSLSVTSF